MRRPVLVLLTLALITPPASLAVAPDPAQAQAGCRGETPQPGSQRRMAILNALRPHVEAMVGEDVEFMVDRIRVACDFARVIVRAQTPGGHGNHYEPVDALLQRSNGTWRMRQIACTEVGCAPAAQQYSQAYPNLPRALLF